MKGDVLFSDYALQAMQRSSDIRAPHGKGAQRPSMGELLGIFG